jgi:hypothetical protein
MDLDRSVLYIAGAAMLAVAAVVLAARPGRGVNRALAALITARGASILLPQVSDDPAWTLAALNVQPYFTFAIIPMALYCLHAFLRSGGVPVRRGSGWIALAAVAVLDLAYFLDHSLLHSLAPGEAAVGALRAGPGLQFTAFGPLAVVGSTIAPALGYVGLRLAMQYREHPTAPNARLLLLVASGLMLGALFDGASRLVALTSLLDQPGDYPWLPWGWSVAFLPVLALLPALLSVAVVASKGQAEPRPLRRTERLMTALAGFAFFSGFLRLVAPADSDVAGSGLVLVLLGAWRLVTPVLIGYALVRHPDWPSKAPAATPPPTPLPPARDGTVASR